MVSEIRPDGSARVQVYGSSVSGNRKYKTEFRKLEQYLHTEEIPFEFVDVAADEEAKAYMKRKSLGNTALPQIYCDGQFKATFAEVEEAVEGFQLRELLGVDEEPVDHDDLTVPENLTEKELAELDALLNASANKEAK
ncbi:hypothetical protein IWQ60_008834 [Tieghemiomyces parasiticus]|uniref:Glutaredoxin n=1 Tax=Tieghemiomyces parasiticus TaxID=78921 RepID=A0A9W7ZR93_9FUNG|nr:hypothetical protein IWQ60_011323 [Tieghemiomyces parasiticus]KAJ1914369.1 hypothetical protein IWQ60_008834 [Tieghemiomyces parasiticus]